MSIESRLRRIEKKLEPESKGPWLQFPLRDGTFIEVPGCRTLVDAFALCMARNRELDETERK